MAHHKKMLFLLLLLSLSTASFINGMQPHKRARAATVTQKERIGGRMGDAHEIFVYQMIPLYTPASESYQYSFEIKEHGQHDAALIIS